MSTDTVRRDVITISAAVIVAAGAFLGVILTNRTSLRTQAQAAEAQVRAQQLQAIGQSGERICTLVRSPSLIPAFSSYPTIAAFSWKRLCDKFAEEPPSLPVQRELVRQLVAHPNQRAEILAMWRSLYPTVPKLP